MIPSRVKSLEIAAQEKAQSLSLLIEQYKAMRQMISDVVTDRNANNKFLLTIVTVILGAQGYLLKDSFSTSSWPTDQITLAFAASAAIGVGLCYIWILWNKSYGIALRVRYELLKDMETQLPAQPLSRENELREKYGYTPVVDIIGKLAALFCTVFLVELIASIFLAYRVS